MYSNLIHKISQTLEEILGWKEKYKNLIFVSGFHRSGTTFIFEVIAKLTGYRTVFEPMHYTVPKSGVFNKYGKKFTENKKEKRQYFPYFDKNEPKLKERHFFEKTIRGEVLHPRVDRYRSIGDFAKRGTVVKCVRSNLLFDWFCQSFGARGVLIVRHPCAVLDSIRRQTWGWWFFKKKFLRLFLSQDSL